MSAVARRIAIVVRCIERAREELVQAGLIDAALSQRLQKMVRFRNIAVHQYQTLDLDIVESVIRTGLDDLLAFAQTVRGPLQD